MRICTICARAGSKGVPGKNLRLLHGRPLIEYTIEQARASGAFEVLAVSSDDADLLQIAGDAGVDLLVERPHRLASDAAGKVDAISHCVVTAEERLGHTFQTIVDLDVTSPLRLPSDIRAAIELLEASTATNVVTACPSRRSPYFNLVELDDAGHVQLSKPLPSTFTRRQDVPRSFDMNASIYVWRREPFLTDPKVFYDRTILYEMPEERSIDIDTELDWRIVELLTTPEVEG